MLYKKVGVTYCRLRRHFSHKPVMADEIVDLLKPQDGQTFIDMTFGGGGHTRRLLDTNKSIRVVAIDRDQVAQKKAQELAAEVAIKSERLNIKQSVIPIHGKFSDVFNKIHLSGIEYGTVNGVIFDLGASSMQYDNGDRGFSISHNGALDMRMDTTNSTDITAEDVVNNLSQEKLAEILKVLGEERRSRKIANAIIDARTMMGRIKTTAELARIVESASRSSFDSLGRFAHPATKTFQAIRIFVNNELNELNYALDKIHKFMVATAPTENTKSLLTTKLDRCGIIAVLTFHSLEDRIVKRHLTGVDMDQPVIKCLSQHDRIRTNVVSNKTQLEKAASVKRWLPILKHVKKPSDDEMAANPRSRSAKLRAALCLMESES